MRKLQETIAKIVVDETRREQIVFRMTVLTLGIVSVVMTIVNLMTDMYLLGWSTAIFAACCVIDYLLMFGGKRLQALSKILFQVEIIVLFTFFIVSGTPEGFSAFWTVMLPLCGLLLWGLKYGTAISLLMFVIVAFLCWAPAGRNMIFYQYSESFLLRFPFLYIAFYFISLVLSGMLYFTQRAYNRQAERDTLTNALNRAGLAKVVAKDAAEGSSACVGFVIMDLDFFKSVNDTYGHATGDEVLKYAVDIISKMSPYPVCRWGGEEFAFYVPNGNATADHIDEIRRAFDEGEFHGKNGIVIPQKISIGAIVCPRPAEFTPYELSVEADKCLYEAKETGRNKTVFRHVEGIS